MPDPSTSPDTTIDDIVSSSPASPISPPLCLHCRQPMKQTGKYNWVCYDSTHAPYYRNDYPIEVR